MWRVKVTAGQYEAEAQSGMLAAASIQALSAVWDAIRGTGARTLADDVHNAVMDALMYDASEKGNDHLREPIEIEKPMACKVEVLEGWGA